MFFILTAHFVRSRTEVLTGTLQLELSLLKTSKACERCKLVLAKHKVYCCGVVSFIYFLFVGVPVSSKLHVLWKLFPDLILFSLSKPKDCRSVYWLLFMFGNTSTSLSCTSLSECNGMEWAPIFVLVTRSRDIVAPNSSWLLLYFTGSSVTWSE